MGKNQRNDIIAQISELIGVLPEQDRQRILDIIKPKIPISAFQAGLSGLEIIIKYLREQTDRSFKEISLLLNRALPTIYTTYNNSRLKFPLPLDISDKSILVPVETFRNRTYSVLESLAAYLKDKEHLSLKEISAYLNKKYDTIKTVYRRFRLKKYGRR